MPSVPVEKMIFIFVSVYCLGAKESIILVRWLADVCLLEAKRTGAHHDELRAGIFIALAAMRALLGKAGPNLLAWELAELERLNSLYHDCLNGSFASSAYRSCVNHFGFPPQDL